MSSQSGISPSARRTCGRLIDRLPFAERAFLALRLPSEQVLDLIANSPANDPRDQQQERDDRECDTRGPPNQADGKAGGRLNKRKNKRSNGRFAHRSSPNSLCIHQFRTQQPSVTLRPWTVHGHVRHSVFFRKGRVKPSGRVLLSGRAVRTRPARIFCPGQLSGTSGPVMLTNRHRWARL